MPRMLKKNDPVAQFFALKVPLYKVLLIAGGFCLLAGVFIWLQWNPLMRELGYTKETIPSLQTNIAQNDAPPDIPSPEALRQSINRNIDLNRLFSSNIIGQDKDALLESASTAPSNCATFQVPAYGAEELCIWVNGEHAVIFTLFNNKIIAKSKIGF